MNEEFNLTTARTKKGIYQYTRSTIEDGVTTERNETLFGSEKDGCDFTEQKCNRKCSVNTYGKKKRKSNKK
jgi:hypothetical protein